MDLSKAYDCLPHDLLVAKFEACGIDKTGLNLIHILEDLRYDMVTLLRWLKENSRKVNSKKFQFMILGKVPRQPIMLNIDQIKVEEYQKSSSTGPCN